MRRARFRSAVYADPSRGDWQLQQKLAEVSGRSVRGALSPADQKEASRLARQIHLNHTVQGQFLSTYTNLDNEMSRNYGSVGGFQLLTLPGHLNIPYRPDGSSPVR